MSYLFSNLPQYPAPASNGQPYLSYGQQQPPMQYGQPAGGNGYTPGYPAPSGHHQGYNLTGQIAQPQVGRLFQCDTTGCFFSFSCKYVIYKC